MRLVHYYPRALVGDGGPTRAMWQWVNASHAAGCDVAVVYDAALEAQSPLRNPDVPTIALIHSGRGRFRAPRRLSSALAPHDVLVLHSAYVPANLVAARSAFRRGFPYIVMPHGGYNRKARQRRQHRKQAWLPLERAYLERALAVHVFFNCETEDTRQVAPHARWLVAPTGFQLPSERWDGGTGGYLAWIGRYDIPTKGLDLLIEAIGQLPTADLRPLRLHGRPSENRPEELARLTNARGLSDVVTIGGEIPERDKADFLRQSVAYVHPSRWESHSMAIIEALAYGIPSVVSQFCSIAQNLQAADAAVIVDATAADIARGISTILRTPQHYSERAVQFVRTNLSWSVIVDDYLHQIDQLLRRP
jgi:glycosyltransferase involved in cell wall biosynthesis